eukprot:757971-Hanusia_phi.AAC.2
MQCKRRLLPSSSPRPPSPRQHSPPSSLLPAAPFYPISRVLPPCISLPSSNYNLSCHLSRTVSLASDTLFNTPYSIKVAPFTVHPPPALSSPNFFKSY